MNKGCDTCLHEDKTNDEDPCNACAMDMNEKFRFWEPKEEDEKDSE